MKGWKLGVLLAGIAVAVIALAVHAIVRKVRRDKARTRVLDACDITGKTDTIFVTLVSYRDPAGAGATLHSLFSNAHCPLRVYVGLCEFYDGGGGGDDASAAVRAYEEAVKASTAPFCLKDHVRVLRVPYAESLGGFAAREQLERFLFRDEKFVLSLDAPAVLAPNWDAYLIDTLQSLRSRHGDKVVLTTQPKAVARAALLAPASGVGLGGGCRVSTDAPGTFVAVDAKTAHVVPVPRASGFALKRRPEDPVPATAWSPSLSFSLGRRVKDVPYPLGVVFCESMHDFVMDTALTQAGYALFHPPGEVAASAYGATRPRRDGEARSREAQCAVSLARAAYGRPAAAAVLKRMGVVFTSPGDPATLQISARGRMGLTPQPKPEEIDAKLGSRTAYISLLSRAELQQQHQQQRRRQDVT